MQLLLVVDEYEQAFNYWKFFMFVHSIASSPEKTAFGQSEKREKKTKSEIEIRIMNKDLNKMMELQ